MFEAVQHFVFLSRDWHPVAERFYCPICISESKPPQPPGWGQRYEVAAHLEKRHDWVEPTVKDALSSKMLAEELVRWRYETQQEGDEFGLSLRLVRGVDDFLSECEVT